MECERVPVIGLVVHLGTGDIRVLFPEWIVDLDGPGRLAVHIDLDPVFVRPFHEAAHALQVGSRVASKLREGPGPHHVPQQAVHPDAVESLSGNVRQHLVRVDGVGCDRLVLQVVVDLLCLAEIAVRRPPETRHLFASCGHAGPSLLLPRSFGNRIL